jgi:hypothetical protein
MTRGILPRVISLSLLWAMAVAAADVTGLRQQSEVKITTQMAGAPFAGDTAPSVWAISFSPNGQYLAFGVQFVRTKDFNFPSYLLVVSPDRPDVVLKKFEVPRHPAMRNVSTIVWSRDSRFLVVTPYIDWDRAAVVDLDANQLHVVPDRLGVPWCGGAAGLLPGLQLVQQCHLANGAGSAIRFLEIDGRASTSWNFPGVVSLLDISPDGKTLALDFLGPPGKVPTRNQHEIAVLNIGDRSDVRRWSLPEAVAYGGVFAESGTAFCTEPKLESVRSKHEWVCRNIATGSEILRRPLSLGVGGIRIVANRLIIGHSKIWLVPFPLSPLLDTDHIITQTDQEMWDFQTGRKIASWRIDWQKVLPKADAASESTVSPDGELVAVGGSGILRVYRVSP